MITGASRRLLIEKQSLAMMKAHLNIIHFYQLTCKNFIFFQILQLQLTITVHELAQKGDALYYVTEKKK